MVVEEEANELDDHFLEYLAENEPNSQDSLKTQMKGISIILSFIFQRSHYYQDPVIEPCTWTLVLMYN